jgi:hypothetical protein
VGGRVKTKKIIIIIAVLIGLVVGLRAISSVFFKRSLIGPKSVVRSTGCTGWKRTGIMTKEENELFLKLEEACSKRDLKTMNEILGIPNNRITVTCRPIKQRFLEPDTPVVEISIRNNLDKQVNILEPAWRRYTSTGNCNGTWTDDFDLGPSDNPRYLKIIKPQDSYTITKELSVEQYGKHEIEVSFSMGVWNEITPTEHEMKSIVANRTTCQFYWDESAENNARN